MSLYSVCCYFLVFVYVLLSLSLDFVVTKRIILCFTLFKVYPLALLLERELSCNISVYPYDVIL